MTADSTVAGRMFDQWTYRLGAWDGDQPHAGRPTGSAAGGCVVFFTRRADPETTELQRVLALLGVPSRRVDADDPGSIELDLNDPGLLRLDGSLVRPTACWTRRFWASAMALPRSPADVLHRDSWLALVRQSPELAPVAFPGPGLGLGLLEQLNDAARAGIRIPATIVTTDPAEAARRLPGDRLVVKTLGPHFAEPVPGTLHGLSPRVLPRGEIGCHDGLPPLVVQEYVRHRAEYRVYFVRGELIMFEVSKPSPDAIWRAQEAVRVRAEERVPEVRAVVARLAERWSLAFGAFDVLLTDDGVVFLEVNADGDWRWYETKAGTRSVSRTIALTLRDLHLAAGGHATRSGVGLLMLLAG
ncbi:hypothetical protein [Nonomuraea sp. NPDC050643]|uniref:ATP-grasp domain-containing protein n=1 Tax=Nonomuraea sp. NPDC050643 TaxID=3155660 RepID=UPI003400CB41